MSRTSSNKNGLKGMNNQKKGLNLAE